MLLNGINFSCMVRLLVLNPGKRSAGRLLSDLQLKLQDRRAEMSILCSRSESRASTACKSSAELLQSPANTPSWSIFVPDVMKVLFTVSALGGVSWFGTLGQGHSF